MFWEESRENFESKESAGILKRYKLMLSEQRTEFFDVSDFEFIADQYIELSQFSAALQACEIALKQHPNSTIVKIKIAQIHLSQLKYAKALQLLKELEEIEGTNPDVMMMLGTCYNMQGESARAAGYFEKAENYAFEERDELLYNIGISFIQTGAYEDAIVYLEKAIQENPDHEPVLYDLAFCYEKVGNDVKAIEYYNRYIDKDPWSESAWYNLGIIYNRQEDYDKAIESYDYALAIDENYVAAIFNKANALSATEQFTDAIAAYQEYLLADPESVDAHLYMADCYFQLDDFDQAGVYYDKAIAIEPNSPDGWFGAGLIRLINNTPQEAVPLLKKSLSLNPESAECWNALGKAFALMDEQEPAKLAYIKALELDSEIPEYWLSYSDFLFNGGHFDEAIRALENAEFTEASSAGILYRLAGFYLLTDRTSDGAETLEAALTEDFNGHIDFLDNFPAFINTPWIMEMIEKFRNGEEDLEIDEPGLN